MPRNLFYKEVINEKLDGAVTYHKRFYDGEKQQRSVLVFDNIKMLTYLKDKQYITDLEYEAHFAEHNEPENDNGGIRSLAKMLKKALEIMDSKQRDTFFRVCRGHKDYSDFL